MDFKVKGHSSYILSLEDDMVRKSSKHHDERLIKSAKKQENYNSAFFKSPAVNEIGKDYFLMDYIKGHSFVEFFTYATKNDIDKLIKKLDGYFKENINGKTSIPREVFVNKINSIDNTIINTIDNIPNEVEVFTGNCHGDLTFSNMIFSNDIYLVDFLDSYIESPTMDLIKLRQDTHLHWSLEMSEQSYDLNKILISLNYLDEWITSSFDIPHYNFLQKINLYRILPYSKTERVNSFITSKLAEL